MLSAGRIPMSFHWGLVMFLASLCFVNTMKTVHSIRCQGMFLKWLTLCSYRTELNAPLPPLAAHVATPDGTHQQSMCKTDQPPCQLMRPRRINNRVETDTYFSLYWLYNDKCKILFWTLWPTRCSVNGLLLMECMCLSTLCVGVHHPAKQRFGVGRHNSHFRNSNVS